MNDFLWTDMSSSKWYIIYPQGHEGPYSLKYLEEKLKENKIDYQIKVWAEGLSSEMTLEAVLALAKRPLQEEVPLDELPPPLPPLSIEEEPIIGVASPQIQKKGEGKGKGKGKFLVIFILFLILIGSVFYYLHDKKKNLTILRPQGMSLKVGDKINDYLEFKKWNEPLFLKEFIADDYNTLWLASSSFHHCEVSANFKSLEGKLLSLNEEEVEFEGRGKLQNHLTEFSKIDFITGRKIIPGMYEMSVQAKNCRWDGPIAQVMNFFKTPDESYSAKMTVILYPGGADEFKNLLDKVVRKKLEKEVREQNQVDLFWQGVQEKLQTLLAISLQIEQLLIDFIKKDSREFNTNLPLMINEYTDKFGKFLTNFVVKNEENFKEINLSEIKGVSTRKNYEFEISESARVIGYTSMKIIEDFQKLKNPRRVHLDTFEKRVKEEFSELKLDINQKIIQVSDERSLSPDEDLKEENPSQK